MSNRHHRGPSRWAPLRTSRVLRRLRQQQRVPVQGGARTGAADDITGGDVPVVDLFVILVENHRLEVRDAVRRLTMAMQAAGYPADSERVSAVDAMDILESVLGPTA